MEVEFSLDVVLVSFSFHKKLYLFSVNHQNFALHRFSVSVTIKLLVPQIVVQTMSSKGYVLTTNGKQVIIRDL